MLADMKDIKALRSLDVEKLKKELEDAQRHAYVMRMKKAQWELKQTHHMSEWRKYIAQIKTLMNNN